MKKIILAVLLTGTLAACSGADKPECWRATNKTVGNSCDSGGSGVAKPGSRTNLKAKKQSNKNNPSPSEDNTPPTGADNNNPSPSEDNPERDNTPPNDTEPGQNVPDQDNNTSPPNQSSSGDIEGYDPFGGLYGPGT